MIRQQPQLRLAGIVNLGRLPKWNYSLPLLFSGANTLCSVVFQLVALYKLGVGARSDLYYASIIIPTVAFSLAFGALNSVLVPMFVEAKARGNGEESTLLWNCFVLTLPGGLLVLAVLYYPALFAFPLAFRKLVWLDMGQVSGILLFFSLYQLFYTAVLAKSCFLFAQGRPILAQTGVFFGWLVSLSLLSRFHGSESLARIPLCLVAGNAAALVFPNFGVKVLSYRVGMLRSHVSSLLTRTLPITAGTSVGWLEPAIDGIIASTLRQGSLTIYYFFGRVMFYIATAIFSGYIQPLTKQLSELAGSGRWQDLRDRTNSVAIHATLLGLVLWACSVVALFLLEISDIIFLRTYMATFIQNFPVLLLLLGYLLGTLGYAVFSNGLYVMQRERLFLLASVTTFPIGIVLKLIGTRLLGLQGLAAGTSVYWISWATVLAVCFWWALRLSQRNARCMSYSSSYQDPAVEISK